MPAIAKNNHSATLKSNHDLQRALSNQEFDADPDAGILRDVLAIAEAYVATEKVIAVLSDLKTHRSYMRLGQVASMLPIETSMTRSEINSIWESDIFSLIHPDDLQRKHIEELRFFDFVMSQPVSRRSHYYLISPLRMRSTGGHYLSMTHRIFYFTHGRAVRYALCLYGIPSGQQESSLIINSITGENVPIDSRNCTNILTSRERTILSMIASGQRTKEIAAVLGISVFTINRHRQNILGKLSAPNSAAAVRMARTLSLI